MCRLIQQTKLRKQKQSELWFHRREIFVFFHEVHDTQSQCRALNGSVECVMFILTTISACFNAIVEFHLPILTYNGILFVNSLPDINHLKLTNAAHLLIAASKPIWNSTNTDKLKRDLLMNYDKYARPTEHFNTTTVSINLSLVHLELEEAESVLHVYCWTYMVCQCRLTSLSAVFFSVSFACIRQMWNDEKLKWNPSEYENLTVIPLALHEVWQPDISLYNSASGNNVDYFGTTHLLVQNDGKTTWWPSTHFRAFCALDMHYWPFDKHECKLVIGSWVLDGRQIDLVVHGDGVDISDLMLVKNEWQIEKISAKRNVKQYSCCEEPYIDITYSITLERSSPMYRTVIIVPAVVIIFMTLATFWLPAHRGEKILLNGVTAIIIVMFLMYFAQKLNVMAFHTPLIGMCANTLLGEFPINFVPSLLWNASQ